MSRLLGEIVELRRTHKLLSLEWKLHTYDFYFEVTHESSHFPFCNATWFMRLVSAYSGYMSFSLHRIDNNTPKTFNVAASVKRSNVVEIRKEVEQKFTSESPSWCVKNLCMNNLPLTITLEIKIPDSARDEPLHKECQVKLPDEKNLSSEKEAVEELQSSFRNLLKNEEDSDVVIKVQGKEFRAHRYILRARSPVFHAMFAHDMVEKQKGVVTMEDCDPENFPDFLDHIYTGSVAMICAKNVCGLFESSDKYNLKILQKECAKFMKKNITVDSFCDIIMLGVRHNEKELIDSATEFFCRNSLDIIKTPKWQIFLKENTTVGNELLIKLLSKQ